VSGTATFFSLCLGKKKFHKLDELLTLSCFLLLLSALYFRLFPIKMPLKRFAILRAKKKIKSSSTPQANQVRTLKVAFWIATQGVLVWFFCRLSTWGSSCRTCLCRRFSTDSTNCFVRRTFRYVPTVWLNLLWILTFKSLSLDYDKLSTKKPLLACLCTN